MNVREHKNAATRERVERACLMDYKDAKFDDNSGIFEGYVAVFNNQDLNGDVIERGAFKKTLDGLHETKARENRPYLFPILWQHNEREPIGGCIEAREDDNGLFMRGQYDLDTELGKRAYSGAKKGYLLGLSIGYDTIKSTYDSNKTRHLLELRLWEGSPVTFPANPQAGIRTVKNVKAVSGKTDWPIADRDAAWDSGAAHGRIVEWAGGTDNPDVSKLKSVHFWSPDDDPTKVSEYKFLFCDVIDGKVQAVPEAIFASTGSHGIQAAKGVDVDGIKGKIATYYGRMSKQFDDDSLVVPWSTKALRLDLARELKDVGGLAALTNTATCLDDIADGAECLVECLAESCGMSLNGGDAETPAPAVAALLAGVDGLGGVVKAVIMAWQEFNDQTDALLCALGLPDNDYGSHTAVPMYMSALRSAFELKTGRELSQSNIDRLNKHVNAVTASLGDVKAMIKSASNPLSDENNQGADYGDYVASGQHNNPGKKGTGQEPGHKDTTPSTPQGEPGSDDTTLTDIQATLIGYQFDALARGLAGSQVKE